MLFGAGGAARAIGVETALAGVRKITVVNRDPSRGKALAELLATKTPAQSEFTPWTGEHVIPDGAEIVVNATSIGLFPDVDARLPIDASTILSHMVVADVIANHPNTRLVREATDRGAVVIDGLGMLVNQGVISVKYWTGIDADPAVMRKTVEGIFGL